MKIALILISLATAIAALPGGSELGDTLEKRDVRISPSKAPTVALQGFELSSLRYFANTDTSILVCT